MLHAIEIDFLVHQNIIMSLVRHADYSASARNERTAISRGKIVSTLYLMSS